MTTIKQFWGMNVTMTNKRVWLIALASGEFMHIQGKEFYSRWVFDKREWAEGHLILFPDAEVVEAVQSTIGNTTFFWRPKTAKEWQEALP